MTTNYAPLQGPYHEPDQIALQNFSSPEFTGYSTHRKPFEREHSDFSYSGPANSTNGDGTKLISGSFHQPSDSTSHFKPYAPPESHRHRILTNWWREAVAVFLLIGSVVATFATLYPYQGRPIPEWPLRITPNALLSVYMLILRGSVGYLLAEGIAHQKWRWFDEKDRPLYDLALHDEASRGPYGAIKLLWRTNIRHVWHWLGCILVLVAIFIGPFSQQVIQYVDCVVPAESGVPLASLPRTNFFQGGGVHDGAGLVTITAPEQAAINAGTYAPGGQVPFTCPSGNCTFPDYTTLGYCSHCDDISSSLKIKYANFTGGEVNNNSPGCRTSSPDGLSVTWLNYTFNRNYSTLDLVGYNEFQVIFGLPYAPFDPNTGIAPTGCEDAEVKDSWRCKGYGAANCTLFPCIRTYSGNVTDNVLSETLLAETSQQGLLTNLGNDANGSYVGSAINTTCLTTSELDLFEKAGYQLNSSSEWVSYNMTGNATLTSESPSTSSAPVSPQDLVSFEQEIQKRGCLYIMQTFWETSLPLFLQPNWAGNLTGTTNNDGEQVTLFRGPQVLQTLYNYGDFSFNFTDSLFKNLSISLTNYMRTSPGTTSSSSFLSTPAYGSQSTNKTCLRVDWPWLSLPGLLVVFTLVYVAGALLSLGNLSHGMRTWRSSPLPLIFHGPRLEQENLQDIRDMERVAKGLRVRLVPVGDGGMGMRVQGGG